MTTNPATVKQVSYLEALARKVGRNATIGGETGPTARLTTGFTQGIRQMNTKQASALISQFQGILGITPKPKPKKAKTASRGFRCGRVFYPNRWAHEQDCNNPGCPGS